MLQKITEQSRNHFRKTLSFRISAFWNFENFSNLDHTYAGPRGAQSIEKKIADPSKPRSLGFLLVPCPRPKLIFQTGVFVTCVTFAGQKHMFLEP